MFTHLSLVMLTLLAVVGRAPPGDGIAPVGCKDPPGGALYYRLQGRVMGWQIRRGMTLEQLNRVIGGLKFDKGQFSNTGSWMCNTRYGLCIGMRHEVKDDGRTYEFYVATVSFLPLLGD
jgi:hypothetical protein